MHTGRYSCAPRRWFPGGKSLEPTNWPARWQVPRLIDGLCAIQKASTAMTSFWQTELAPALQAGYRPPIAAGFGHFVAAPGVAKELSDHLEAELRKTGTNSFDTHPPLAVPDCRGSSIALREGRGERGRRHRLNRRAGYP